jgi:hypothetical protein
MLFNGNNVGKRDMNVPTLFPGNHGSLRVEFSATWSDPQNLFGSGRFRFPLSEYCVAS